MTDKRLVTYRELDPTVDWTDRVTGDPNPDSPVEVSGHPLYRYDHEKAQDLIRRCQQLGGFEFRASADLAYMHVGPDTISAHEHGFHLVVDESLAENTVVAA